MAIINLPYGSSNIGEFVTQWNKGLLTPEAAQATIKKFGFTPDMFKELGDHGATAFSQMSGTANPNVNATAKFTTPAGNAGTQSFEKAAPKPSTSTALVPTNPKSTALTTVSKNPVANNKSFWKSMLHNKWLFPAATAALAVPAAYGAYKFFSGGPQPYNPQPMPYMQQQGYQYFNSPEAY